MGDTGSQDYSLYKGMCACSKQNPGLGLGNTINSLH